MEIYSTIKRNELLKHTTCMDFILMLYGKKDIWKCYIYSIMIFIEHSQNDKIIVMENRSMVRERELGISVTGSLGTSL